MLIASYSYISYISHLAEKRRNTLRNIYILLNHDSHYVQLWYIYCASFINYHTKYLCWRVKITNTPITSTRLSVSFSFPTDIMHPSAPIKLPLEAFALVTFEIIKDLPSKESTLNESQILKLVALDAFFRLLEGSDERSYEARQFFFHVSTYLN